MDGDPDGRSSEYSDDPDEVRRRAEAESDLLRAGMLEEADSRRRQAERLLEQAHRELVLAQEHALRVRAEADQRADAIVRAAERRAREEADSILGHARRRLAEVIDQTRPARRLPLLRGTDPLMGRPAPPFVSNAPPAAELPENVIDLRERIGTMPKPLAPAVPDTSRHPSAGDPLDEMVRQAVVNAVGRAVRPPVIRAGRYA